MAFKDPSPRRYEFVARASQIDPRVQAHPEIDFFLEKNGKPADEQHASVDTRVKPQGKLVIWLMGPSPALFERVNSYGLHAIRVHYANGWFGRFGKEPPPPDDKFLGKIRLEAATGEDFSDVVAIPKPDGMMERSLQFVKWLAKENPQGRWDFFLSPDGKSLRWDRVIISGASHGATTATRFAKHQRVDRVVMFCGPRDQHETWQALPSATPANRFFGFSHVLDGGWTGHHYDRSWEMIGLNQYGPIVNVDHEKPPYQNSRQLITDADVKNNASRAHSSVVPGGAAVKDAAGKFLHEDVWRYLFNHPVDAVGKPAKPATAAAADWPEATMFCSLGKPEGFMAGAAAVDITPDKFPLSLRGSFTPRPASEVHDPLHARAMAVQNGEGRAVIVIVDNLDISRETLDAIKVKAAEATGWRAEQMLIAATHTHTAPSISGEGGSEAAVACREKAAAGILRAITDAVGSLQPASVGWGTDAVPDEVFNRRWYLKDGKMPLNPFGEIDQVKMNPPHDLITKPAGPTDPEVNVLDIRTRKRQPIAVLANYSLHYVGGVPADKISADYYGEFARLMPSRVPGGKSAPNFVAMLSNGSSGDINNIDFTGTRPPREPFEQIRLVAAKVADASWRATANTEHHPDASVAMRQREIELKYRKPTAEQLERAKKILAMPAKEQKDLPNLAVNYAHRVVASAERPTDRALVLVQALRIGDQAIVTMPFEVFVEIGLEIRKRSPFARTFLISHANGATGYLPPPHQHELGGYETWLGTNHVEKDSSVILVRNLLEMLEELK